MDLSSTITIIVVTSPISSNPNTELIDRCISGVFRSFPEELRHCRLIIACDGVQVVTAQDKEQISRAKTKTKRIFGKCDQGTFDRYDTCIRLLSKQHWIDIVRQSEWKGFALSLKSAIEQVQTELVMVLPHDYELSPEVLAQINLSEIVHEMLHRSDINYIGLPNRRSANIKSRHAKALQDLSSILFSNCYNDSEKELELEPIGMWKENPHFAKTDSYRRIVFSRHYKRGQFIEDTLGQEMLTQIKERGQEAFPGMYIMGLSQPCSFHLDGPRYIPISTRIERGYHVQDFEIEAVKQAEALMQARKLEWKGHEAKG